ncbi:YkvS family protein [Scopulibacillus cellulosilyticus]|uniref:YkvS family protein n=1 Tax=Scopulibacillus cellulosilyticus TaxID=2665665 RepID=A0ABW2PXL3_9BACL
MQKAEINDLIEFWNGLQAKVISVFNNTVIADLTCMDNFNELNLEPRTVLTHQEYKVIKKNY